MQCSYVLEVAQAPRRTKTVWVRDKLGTAREPHKMGPLAAAHLKKPDATYKNSYISTNSSTLAILIYILVNLLAKKLLQPFQLQFRDGVAAI